MPDCFRFQEEKKWGQDDFWVPGKKPFELHGKTLGLVGLGAIGHELAPRARAMGMRILVVKRDPSRGGELADRVYAAASCTRCFRRRTSWSWPCRTLQRTSLHGQSGV